MGGKAGRKGSGSVGKGGDRRVAQPEDAPATSPGPSEQDVATELTWDSRRDELQAQMQWGGDGQVILDFYSSLAGEDVRIMGGGSREENVLAVPGSHEFMARGERKRASVPTPLPIVPALGWTSAPGVPILSVTGVRRNGE